MYYNYYYNVYRLIKKLILDFIIQILILFFFNKSNSLFLVHVLSYVLNQYTCTYAHYNYNKILLFLIYLYCMYI